MYQCFYLVCPPYRPGSLPPFTKSKPSPNNKLYSSRTLLFPALNEWIFAAIFFAKKRSPIGFLELIFFAEKRSPSRRGLRTGQALLWGFVQGLLNQQDNKPETGFFFIYVGGVHTNSLFMTKQVGPSSSKKIRKKRTDRTYKLPQTASQIFI